MPAIKVPKTKWLKLGLKLFAEFGINGINVEKMASQLKCNKSSFYWHFQNRNKFIKEMLLQWHYSSSSPIPSLVDKEKNARSRIERYVVSVAMDFKQSHFEFYLSRLAEKDPEIAFIQEGIKKQNLLYVRLLIEGLGYQEPESSIKTESLVLLIKGWKSEFSNQNLPNKKALTHLIALTKSIVNY